MANIVLCITLLTILFIVKGYGKFNSIRVYSITEGEDVCGDNIRKWENMEAERIVFELKKKLQQTNKIAYVWKGK